SLLDRAAVRRSVCLFRPQSPDRGRRDTRCKVRGSDVPSSSPPRSRGQATGANSNTAAAAGVVVAWRDCPTDTRVRGSLVGRRRLTREKGLIQSLSIAPHRDDQGDSGEQGDGPKLEGDVCEAVALEQDAADDAQEMSERQDFADHLGPDRHAAEGESEAGQE